MELSYLEHARGRSRVLGLACKGSFGRPAVVQSHPIRTFLTRQLGGAGSTSQASLPFTHLEDSPHSHAHADRARRLCAPIAQAQKQQGGRRTEDGM